MIDPSDLLGRWKQDEERFRLYGEVGVADVIERCRIELAEWWRERQLLVVTATEASKISGYSKRGLRLKRARGELSKVAGGYVLGELPVKARKQRLLSRADQRNLVSQILRSRETQL